jgi:hypothetical protein
MRTFSIRSAAVLGDRRDLRWCGRSHSEVWFWALRLYAGLLDKPQDRRVLADLRLSIDTCKHRIIIADCGSRDWWIGAIAPILACWSLNFRAWEPEFRWNLHFKVAHYVKLHEFTLCIYFFFFPLGRFWEAEAVIYSFPDKWRSLQFEEIELQIVQLEQVLDLLAGCMHASSLTSSSVKCASHVINNFLSPKYQEVILPLYSGRVAANSLF